MEIKGNIVYVYENIIQPTKNILIRLSKKLSYFFPY